MEKENHDSKSMSTYMDIPRHCADEMSSEGKSKRSEETNEFLSPKRSRRMIMKSVKTSDLGNKAGIVTSNWCDEYPQNTISIKSPEYIPETP